MPEIIIDAGEGANDVKPFVTPTVTKGLVIDSQTSEFLHPRGRNSGYSMIGLSSWAPPFVTRGMGSLKGSTSHGLSSSNSLKVVVDNVMTSQAKIKDESNVYTSYLILVSMLVSLACGFAAFVLHLCVNYAGCLGGVNGCHDQVLLDALEPLGIGKSVFFILMSGLTGLICSLILYAPWLPVARQCKGGGSGHTKLVVASGGHVSFWVVILRIVLASIYMGGGNPLGTEGPIIHLSVSLATWLVARVGKRLKRRKFLGTFAVIGAAAGISAGFNVVVTGFVYVIEELARTLTRKLALILAFAAAVAVFFKDYVERFLTHYHVIHPHHASLVPSHKTLENLTDDEIQTCFLVTIPIGILMGFAGWIYTRSAWYCLNFLSSSQRLRRYLPEVTHLAIIGVLCGCLGAIGYEATGVNGVWGTTVGAIDEAIEKNIRWEQVLLLFLLKFCAFIIATAGGGPGGALVPSLTTGGLLALSVGRLIDDTQPGLPAACAVIGMGAMFASVMHMPLTGVIIMFELTGSERLMVHVVIANFVAANIVSRLPSGEHSFVHLTLERDPTWQKLHHRDFIETDEHETEANLAMFECLSLWIMTDKERASFVFDAWIQAIEVIRLEEETARLEMSSTPKGKPKLTKSKSVSDLIAKVTKRKSSHSLTTCSSTGAISVGSPRGRGVNSPQNSPRRGSGSTDGSICRQVSTESPGLSRAASKNSSAQSEGRKSNGIILPSSDSLPRLSDGERSKSNPVFSEHPFGAPNSSDSPTRMSVGSMPSLSDRRRTLAAKSRSIVNDIDELQRRIANRENWEAVSTIIPNMNVRVWKALGRHQREALASIAQMLPGASSPRDSQPSIAYTFSSPVTAAPMQSTTGERRSSFKRAATTMVCTQEPPTQDTDDLETEALAP